MNTHTHPYTVNDYEIVVRFDVEAGEFTAQVLEMPGVILGGLTAEAALSQTRWMLGEILADCAREGDTPPPPGSRPPERYADALPEPLVKPKPTRTAKRPMRRRRVSHSAKGKLPLAA